MHSKIESAAAPLVATAQHTIIIKASKLKCKKEREKVEYLCECLCQGLLYYASCGDGYLTQNKSRRHNPLLKLYYGMAVMINCHIDVTEDEANRAYCRFGGVKLNPV